MKFRDVVLLLVGGGLVVVGMLMSNLIETDAIADSHVTKAVQYEYKVCISAGTVYRVDYQTQSKEENGGYNNKLSTRKNYTRDVEETLVDILRKEAVDGWILDQVLPNNERAIRTRANNLCTLIFKRVKQ